MAAPSHLATSIADLVHRLSGVVVEESRLEQAELGFGELAAELGIGEPRELLRLLTAPGDPELLERFIEPYLIHETSFFRDAASPFEALEERVLPELIERRRNLRALNVWCGAASSGQEPYSLAMVLEERFPQLADWRIDFLATDLSQEMVQRCRAGVYTRNEVNRGLSARRLVRFFEEVPNGYRVKESLRRRIRFERRNLLDPWRDLQRMDVILLRNVLIYFDAPTKRQLLQSALEKLAPDGCLFLGGSEAPLFYTNGFESRKHGRCVWFVPAKSPGTRVA